MVGKVAKPKQLRVQNIAARSSGKLHNVPNTEKTFPKFDEQAILIYFTVFKSLLTTMSMWPDNGTGG